MESSRRVRLFCVLLCFSLILAVNVNSRAAELDEISKILGTSGQEQEGAAIFRFPRSDLKVSIQGESVPTALGFVSWAGWKNVRGYQSMVMGDLVLLESEISPVISALEQAGFQITGLHNHFLWEQPRVMFMHIHGMGSAPVLAQGMRSALSLTATPIPPKESKGVPVNFDTAQIERITGHAGQSSGGVFKITVGRPGVRMNGVELTSSLGINSWAAYTGTNERAHVAGDMVMTASEVNRVIQVLRKGNIEIVAVHNHMLTEQPRLFYLHYWGTGPVEQLSKTVGAAFSEIKGPVNK